jgi:hypothetical protein
MTAMQTQCEIAEILIGIVTKHGTDEKYRLVLPILILSPQKFFLLDYEIHQIRELVLQARSPQFDSLKISLDWF